MSAIAFDAVTKRYGDGTLAVRELALEIADGELMVFVGPSGCGKSTALRMIAGLEDISDGRLLIDGEVVNDRAPKDRDVAMVFQSYALYPQMTVRDNIGFPLRMAKLDRAARAAKVEDAAAILGLTEQLDRKPGKLSGGQRQRVAMGRAIVRDPAAFLMDEPLSNLDAKLRVQMRAEVAQLQQRLGTTMIYVTHDQTEAMTLGSRVAVLRGGVLQQVAAPTELYRSPDNLFVASFIGSPAMNFLPATVQDDVLRLPFGDVAIEPGLVPRGARLVCGIRPEHLEDAALLSGEQRETGLVVRRQVHLVESLGSEVHVYCDAGDFGDRDDAALTRRVVARCGAESRIAVGDTAELWVDTSKLLLFDADSEAALGAPRPARAPVARS
jgi:multiple sugar transport system ATP-binding protein